MIYRSVKTVRNSSIELLRIFAAMSVFVVHYNFNVAFRQDGLVGQNFALLHLFDSIAIPAVDIFIIITGFFSCLSGSRSIGKPLNLLFQVAFWHILFYFVACIQGIKILSLHGVVSSIITPDYFVTLYVCVYLFSPYINMLLERLSVRDLQFMICLCIGIFSIYSFSIDVLFRDFGIDFRTGSAIGITGGGGGCTIVNFCLLYLIGAWIKLADIDISWKKALCGFVVCAGLLYCWRCYELHIGMESIRLTARSYHNPLVIAQASLALLIAKNFTFRNNVINKLALAAFTCYMIHGYFLKKIGIEKVVFSSVWILLSHITISILAIYILSFLLDYIYRHSVNHLFKRIDNISVPYNK